MTGVTVIAIELDGEIRAMTANSFTSLSLEPPLVFYGGGYVSLNEKGNENMFTAVTQQRSDYSDGG